MEREYKLDVLEADSSYYRNWLNDLSSLERRATGGFDERDWQATREACKLVLISNN
jgi:hypothetical protein